MRDKAYYQTVTLMLDHRGEKVPTTYDMRYWTKKSWGWGIEFATRERVGEATPVRGALPARSTIGHPWHTVVTITINNDNRYETGEEEV